MLLMPITALPFTLLNIYIHILKNDYKGKVVRLTEKLNMSNRHIHIQKIRYTCIEH